MNYAVISLRVHALSSEMEMEKMDVSAGPNVGGGSTLSPMRARSPSDSDRRPFKKPKTRSELDSALALASLALHSPVKSPQQQTREDESVHNRRSSHREDRVDPAQVTPVTPSSRVQFSSSPTNDEDIRVRSRPRPLVRRAVVKPSRPFPKSLGETGHSSHSTRLPVRKVQVAQFQYPAEHKSLIAPPSLNPWVCDFCNQAAFASYDEACRHEMVCRHRKSHEVQQRTESEEGKSNHSMEERDQGVWYKGVTSLSVDADHEWLSELNCFIRENCVEAFSTSIEDSSRSSKRGRVEVDQVGIRCKFCSHHPLSQRVSAAVSYPTSLAGIYESVKRWQRVHLALCADIPSETKQCLAKLQTTAIWIPTTRQYWTDSAKALGMVDTDNGIRFVAPPKKPMKWIPPKWRSCDVRSEHEALDANVSPVYDESKMIEAQKEEKYLCFPDDESLVPPYVYFLMRQVEPCYFTEADRFVARSKGPLGFSGFQCRHCEGHAGLGKYFPLTAKSLATNSTSQNIHAHLLKCRKCPKEIKSMLVQKKEEKGKAPRLVPGWRKTFFDVIWDRLHGDEQPK